MNYAAAFRNAKDPDERFNRNGNTFSRSYSRFVELTQTSCSAIRLEALDRTGYEEDGGSPHVIPHDCTLYKREPLEKAV